MLGDSDFDIDDLAELEHAAGLTPYPLAEEPDTDPDDTRLDLSDDAGDWSPAPGWGYRLVLIVCAVAAAVVAFGLFCRTG